MNEPETSVLEQSRTLLKEIAAQHGLMDAEVCVLAKPLTPEEAIGTPGRRDFPIVVGKERVIEASVLNSRGHAFTDSASEFQGTLQDVLNLALNTNQERAIYIATLNAVLRHLTRVTATVHCRDDDPEVCARQIAECMLAEHGMVRVGLIGLNPAIAERLVAVFGSGNVLFSDLDADNVGRHRFGVQVWSGVDRTEELIDASDVVLFTGTTLVNATFDRIWNRIQKCDKDYLVYGVTGAGVCELLGIRRICPCGRDG